MSQPTPREVYSGLRSQVLSLDPTAIGVVPSPERSTVWGVLMESTFPGALMTFVCLADGTTSLYLSTGGGIIGAGEHENVAAAGEELLEIAQSAADDMSLTSSYPPPGDGRVRFYLLTFSGVVAAEADENELGEGRHELSPLFYQAHEVITQVRISTEFAQE